MKVSGQGKLEFESDLSKMLIKLKKNNDFLKSYVPGLQREQRVRKRVNIVIIL